MSEPQDAVKRAIQVAALAVFLACVRPGLSSADPLIVVRVEIETGSHVGPPHAMKEHIFRPLKLTFHIPASRAEKPVSIPIPEATQGGAGLVVEHIAPDGTRKKQSMPSSDWWFSKSRTWNIKPEALPTRFSFWVLPGMHLDFSKLGIYRISYVHPWAGPDEGPDTPRFQSGTLTMACVTVERSNQLHQMLREHPKLALASYRFRYPPCVEFSKIRRDEYIDEIAPAIREGAERDEVLLLLGSPDAIYYPSPGEQGQHNRREAWSYDTNPVRPYFVYFRNGLVVESKASFDSP